MKKQELKKMLKSLVRECLTEIFAEMKLETIVENVVKKVKHTSTNQGFRKSVMNNLQESTTPEPQSSSQLSKEETRQQMKEKHGVDDATWKAIYEDTIDSDNSVLSGEEKPELVSEAVLKQSGLFKDYSKFIK